MFCYLTDLTRGDLELKPLLISSECSLQHFFTEQTWNQNIGTYEDEYI